MRNYRKLWEIENPKGIVHLIHGMKEYIGRYDEFAKFLNSNGYLVCGHDLVGHGNSTEDDSELGYFTNNWFEIVENEKMLVDEMKEKYKNIPYIILGHSMGSFICRTFSVKYGEIIDGLIIMGTGMIPSLVSSVGLLIESIIEAFNGEKYRSKFIDNLAIGGYNNKFTPKVTQVEWLSRDIKIQEKYIQDKYCNYIPTVAMYREMFKGILFVCKDKNIYNTPKSLKVMIVSGADDPVGDFSKGPKKLYSKFIDEDYKNVELKIYKDMRHEILNEIGKEEVYRDILNWIEQI